jgi:hypothetical protein
MSGLAALFGAFIAFLVPMAVPLAAQRLQSLGIITVIGIAIFIWIDIDLGNPAGVTQSLGPFVFGLMLFGFAAGVIAKFVMLVAKRR